MLAALPKSAHPRAKKALAVIWIAEAAQSRWRVNAPHLVGLVRAGAKFEHGKLVERPDDNTTEEAA